MHPHQDAPDFQSGRSVTSGGYREYAAVGMVGSVFAVLRGWGTSKYSVYPIMFRISENIQVRTRSPSNATRKSTINLCTTTIT